MNDYKPMTPKLAGLLTRREQMLALRDETQKNLNELTAAEPTEKEAYITAEIESMVSPGKATTDTRKAAYNESKSKIAELTERLEVLSTGLSKTDKAIKQATQEAQDKARGLARSDHEKAALKSLKIMRQLAEVQEAERKIVNDLAAAIGYSSALSPTYLFTGLIGNEDTYGMPMNKTIQNLKAHGYKTGRE